ncbi:MAG: M28 family metallopeptidase [Steroidobacteraceae bacterium]
MRRRTVFACLGMATVIAFAESPPAIPPEAIRAHVEYLSHDLLEGRAAGTRGYDLAAHYVASRMRATGLEPAGDNGGWMQSVPLIQATRNHAASSLTIRGPDGQQHLTPLDDFIGGFYFSQSESRVSAPATFVGYGIHAPELGHDDFAGIDLEGRIAVVLSGAPAKFPSSQRAHYSSRSKIEGLVARGAVGMVTVDTPEEETRSPWTRSRQLSWNPRMRLTDAAGMPVDAYPEILGSASVSAAAAPRLFAGATASADEVFAAAREARFSSFELPGEISMALANRLERLQSGNVVGLLRGSDPALAGEYVVLTAHLDHLGRGAAVDGDDIYNGALDNAAGIAIVLEAARALASSTVRPRRSILFVALTAEERGLLGAYYFAAHPTVPRAGIVANLNTDMPEALFPVTGMILLGEPHSTLGVTARAALAAEGLVEVPDPTPEEVAFVRSDQYPFIRAGIPAIVVRPGALSADPAVDAKALQRQFRLNHYHMPSDTVALPIHWPSLAKNAQLLARLARAVADADERPQWLPGDFFGTTFGARRE